MPILVDRDLIRFKCNDLHDFLVLNILMLVAVYGGNLLHNLHKA
jgi:hypothetical protein